MASRSPATVRKACEARLFNLVPQELRDLNGVTVDHFKGGLDSWLKTVLRSTTNPGEAESSPDKLSTGQPPVVLEKEH